LRAASVSGVRDWSMARAGPCYNVIVKDALGAANAARSRAARCLNLSNG